MITVVVVVVVVVRDDNSTGTLNLTIFWQCL
jgi:hypothetical protein